MPIWAGRAAENCAAFFVTRHFEFRGYYLDMVEQSEKDQKAKMLFILTIPVYAIAAAWLVFAIAWMFRPSDYQVMYVTGGLLYAAILAALAYFLGKRRRWAWWLSIIFIGISILITPADQVGWLDITYLVLSVVAFVVLARYRLAFTSASSDSQQQT
jgi:hypothetical protein